RGPRCAARPAASRVSADDTVALRGPPGHYDHADTEACLPPISCSHSGEWAHIACPIDVPDTVCVRNDPKASGSQISRREISGDFAAWSMRRLHSRVPNRRVNPCQPVQCSWN
ncbi:hypothetical protein, partial [Tahibacter caeni]|uniref:hypothetical protein n=1 Tax=Tahibacter caeni TaxID=1453545 RepID=UPI002148CDA7